MSSNRQRVKGVIFDLDETIIDTLSTFTESFNNGIGKFELKPVTDGRIAHFLDEGFRLGEILLDLFPAVFEEDRKRQICEDAIRKTYLELEAQQVVLKPGAKRTFQLLKEKGVKIGIVTGRRTKGERKWLELRRLNIHQFIDVMVTGAEAPAKPAPDGLIKCIEELGLFAKDCVFVGDSRVDIIAGKRVGMRTVAVHTGVAGRELLAKEGPDCILADLNLLFSYLYGLQQAEKE